MSHMISIGKVLEAQAEYIAAEFPGIDAETIQKSAVGRIGNMLAKSLGGFDPELAKAFETTGIIPVGGTIGADASKVEDLSQAIGLQALSSLHCPTYKMIPQKPAISDAVEWVTSDSVGEETGGGWVDPSASDGGTIAIDGSLERKFLTVKFYASQFQNFLNSSAVTAIGFNGRASAGENDNNNKYMALQRHLRNLNTGTLRGDTSTNALEPVGIVAQVRAANSAARVTRFDMNGQPFTPETLAELGSLIYNNSGNLTDIIVDNNAMADWQKQLFSVQRSGMGEKVGMLNWAEGTLVQGIGMDPNTVKLHRDLDLGTRDIYGYDNLAASTNGPTAPSGVVGTAVSGTLNFRKNIGIEANGTYYYSAVAVSAKGKSVPVVSDGVVVTAGQKVNVVVTKVDAATRKYVIYRGLAADAGTHQYIGEVSASGSTSTFVDNGEKVPGTSIALALTIAPMGDGHFTIENRILLPTFLRDLPVTLMTANQAYMTALTPQVRTPLQQIVIENIGRYTV